MKHKHDVFDYPNNNILMYRVTWEEDLLKDNYKVVMKDDIVFRASTDRVRLDQFKTDVVYWGGMDPWEIT